MVSAAVARGTGAATSGAHPFCLFVSGLDVIKQAGAGSGFGTTVDSISLVEHLGRPATLTFEVDDPNHELAPIEGGDVYFCDHGGRHDPAGTLLTDDLFRGIVESKQVLLDSYPLRRWRITALSLDVLLDRKVLRAGTGPALADAAGAYMQDVVASIDPRLSALSNEAAALNVLPSAPRLVEVTTNLSRAVSFAGKTARRVLEELNAACHNPYDVAPHIDPQGRLRWGYNHPQTAVGWYMQLPTVGVAGFYRAAELVRAELDLSDLINSVYVRAGDEPSSAYVTDAISEAQYGRREAYLEAPDALTADDVTAAGTDYLLQHGPIERVELRYSSSATDLLGQLPVTYATRGYHAGAKSLVFSDENEFTEGVLLLHSLRRTWDGGNGHSTLELTYTRGASSGALRVSSSIRSGLQQAEAAPKLRGPLAQVSVPGVHYRDGAVQTGITAGSAVTLDWGGGVDPLELYDPSPKLCTIRTSGLYLILGTVESVNQTAGTGNVVRYDVRVNGAVQTSTHTVGLGANNCRAALVYQARLERGDTIDVRAGPLGATADVQLARMSLSMVGGDIAGA